MVNTPEFIDEVMGAWREGASSSQISRRLGVTRNAVIGIIARYERRHGKTERPAYVAVGAAERSIVRNIVRKKKRSKQKSTKQEKKQTVNKGNRVDKYISVNRTATPARTRTEWGSKEAMRREIEEAMVRTARLPVKV